ncbi:MAG: response regulator transcription factor [Clostridiales bacterium]|jgi:DNA-binding response OmpR family regulator|nr:response regulator transcription factor [Clostridiales bacterium]
MNTVLVIDDDKELCSIIAKYMERAGYFARFSYSGASGINSVAENEYQLVVLDIMLPDIDGFSVLDEIRKTSAVPVLMLTAKNDEADKIRGLKCGADDYLTKPFSMNEFLARVESLIRRYTKLNKSETKGANTIVANGMVIDGDRREVTVMGNRVELTGKEFDLLHFLASNKGRVFTKQQIYNRVWEDEYAFDDSNIMSFISKIRKKIEPDPDKPFYIQTIRGVGYRYNQEA